MTNKASKKSPAYVVEKQDKEQLLEKARNYLQHAHDCIKKVFPNSGFVNEYVLNKLKILISSEHAFMTDDPSIDDLIRRLNDES